MMHQQEMKAKKNNEEA